MKFYDRPKRSPQVIIISLIDIFAILLIFVIVTTTFKKAQPQVTIKLPESKTAGVAEKTTDPVVLTIAADEQIFLAGKKITVQELGPAVRELTEKQPAPPLALNADKKAPFGVIVAVLDALKQAGVKGVPAFTDPKK